MAPSSSAIRARWSQSRHLPRAIVLGLLIACTGAVWLAQHLEVLDLDVVLQDNLLDTLRGALRAGPETGFYGDEAEGFCPVEAIVQGRWETRNELRTADEMKARYNLANFNHHNCHAYALTDDGPLLYTDGIQRSLSIASPELVPAQEGCRTRQTVWRSTIRRLLRMPMGMILVGDSLELQHLDVIDNILRVPGGPVIFDGGWGINRTIHLDASHPDSLVLAREAGVSADRIDRPLVTWWRSNLLADPEELASLFNDTGRFHLKYDAAIDWPTWLAEKWAEVPEHREYAPGVVEEPTVVMLEASAHWGGIELGYQLTDAEMLEGYYKMVAMQESKLRHMRIPMSLYWRTVSPPQIDCGGFPEVDNERYTYANQTDPERKMFNYHLFPLMIDFLRNRFPLQRQRSAFHYMSEGSDMGDQFNPPFRLVDIWDMSVKRPDAHLRPPVDCLHWCLTGVLDHWHMLFWHMILEESRNSDYEMR